MHLRTVQRMGKTATFHFDQKPWNERCLLIVYSIALAANRQRHQTVRAGVCTMYMAKKNSNRKYVIEISISRSFEKSPPEMFRALIFLTLFGVRLVGHFQPFGFDNIFQAFQLFFTKTH